MARSSFLRVGLLGLFAVLLPLGSGPVHTDEVDELKAQLRKAQEEVAALKVELARLKEANEKTKREEALEWAEGVAADFLNALKRKQYGSAASLMSAELKQQLAPGKAELKDQSYDREQLLKTLEGLKFNVNYDFVHNGKKLSPDLSEASFRVTDRDYHWRIRIGAEGMEKGRWRVLFFSKE